MTELIQIPYTTERDIISKTPSSTRQLLPTGPSTWMVSLPFQSSIIFFLSYPIFSPSLKIFISTRDEIPCPRISIALFVWYLSLQRTWNRVPQDMGTPTSLKSITCPRVPYPPTGDITSIDHGLPLPPRPGHIELLVLLSS
jgi:hypothetical protein